MKNEMKNFRDLTNFIITTRYVEKSTDFQNLENTIEHFGVSFQIILQTLQ